MFYLYMKLGKNIRIKLLDSTERCKINKEAFGAYYPKKQLFKKFIKDIFAAVA